MVLVGAEEAVEDIDNAQMAGLVVVEAVDILAKAEMEHMVEEVEEDTEMEVVH